MDIILGDVVTMTNRELRFYHSQAKVVAIAVDGEIGVQIGPKDRDFLFFDESKNKVFWVVPEDLRKEADWDWENRVIAVFGKMMWHSFYGLEGAINPDLECMGKDCLGKRAKRILFNIWGSVCEADVCDDCAKEFHGKSMDSFPWRK
ncbi:MAG: hypothetical protein V1668_01885 [Patescibacteria group bacterium]